MPLIQGHVRTYAGLAAAHASAFMRTLLVLLLSAMARVTAVVLDLTGHRSVERMRVVRRREPAAEPAAVPPLADIDGGHKVDREWARANGYTTLDDYFASLSIPKQDWVKSASLSAAKTLGLVGPASEAVVGMLLGLVPIPKRPTSDGTVDCDWHPRDCLVLEPLVLAAAARELGFLPKRGVACSPLAALRHGEADPNGLKSVSERASAESSGGNVLWPLPGSYPPASSSSLRLPEDMLAAEEEFLRFDDQRTGREPDALFIHEESRPLSEDLLPGLCFGAAGMRSSHTPRELFRSRYVSAVLNRLIGEPEFSVEVTSGTSTGGKVAAATTTATSVHSLFEALGAGAVQGRVSSRITSFGAFLHVKDESTNDEPRLIARTFGMKTGIVDELLSSQQPQELVVPCLHGSLAVRVQLTESVNADVQYYAGVEGFCGWHSDGGPEYSINAERREWRVEHGTLLRMTRSGAALAIAAAECAEKHDMKCGGYGLWGVCNDSVMILQMAVGERVTVAAGNGGGVGKQQLALCARMCANARRDKSAEEERGGSETVDDNLAAEDFDSIADAVWRLPTDATPRQTDVRELAGRILDSLPVGCMGKGKAVGGAAYTMRALREVSGGSWCGCC
jgi:hypothetical protein